MEDLSRSMAREPLIETRSQTQEKAKSWTVLLVGELGNIASFSLSKAFVVSLSVCAALAVAIVLFAVVSYQATLRENEGLKKNMGKLKADLLEADEAKDRAIVNLMLLEAKVKPDEQEEEPAPVLLAKARPAPADTKKDVAKKPEPAKEVSAVQPNNTPEPSGVATPGSLSVEKLQIWQEDETNSVKFQFNLRNTDQQGTKIRGYTFVALKPGEGGQEPVRVSPWTPLTDGKPDMFKRGQYFSIARFKFVRGSFPDLPLPRR